MTQQEETEEKGVYDDFIQELIDKDLLVIDDHVWERCDVCSRRTHPNEIELYKGICADCALGVRSKR